MLKETTLLTLLSIAAICYDSQPVERQGTTTVTHYGQR